MFFSNSAVKVHDSQAYKNMEMARERTSFTFDPRDTLLFVQMGCSFVRAVVACAILERISGLEPSSETTAPRYLKLVTLLNFCPFTFISLWMPLALLRIYISRAKRTRWKDVVAKLSMILQRPCKVPCNKLLNY